MGGCKVGKERKRESGGGGRKENRRVKGKKMLAWESCKLWSVLLH